MSIQKGKEIIRQKIPNLTKSPGVYKMLSEKMKFFMWEKLEIFQIV